MDAPGPRRIDPAYFAGFLDGEGTFVWNGTPTISASNTFPDVLHHLAAEFGGSVRQCRRRSMHKHRTEFSWAVYGSSAVDLALRLLPFLIEKAPQASHMIGASLAPARSQLRRYHLTQLKALKRIDYAADRRD